MQLEKIYKLFLNIKALHGVKNTANEPSDDAILKSFLLFSFIVSLMVPSHFKASWS